MYIENKPNMLEKQHIESLIIRYLQEEIDPGELKALEAWLSRSAGNRAFFFQLKNLYDTRRRPAPATEAEKEAIWQRMRRRMERESCREERPLAGIGRKPSLRRILLLGSGRLYRATLFLKYVAVAVLLFSLGWGLRGYKRQPAMPLTAKSGLSAFHQIRVEKGSRANTLVLADGSKVVLNAGTTFKYPAGFAQACDREVYLDGEAYFEIARDTSRPFRVRLKGQTITVLGTRFNVEAYAGQACNVTTLLSGSISLETFDDEGKALGRALLQPNERACSDTRTGTIKLEKVDPTLSNAWIHGEYKFKDEPLASIIRKLEKAYDVTIFLDDETLKKIRYTGTFSYDQAIGEVLRIINYEKRFVFKQTGKNIILSKRSMSNP